MDRKNLFKKLTYLIVLIFVLNFIAVKLYWYVSIWWFDMPMHFLGGIWIGLFILWLLYKEKIDIKFVGQVVLAVFAVGVAWEIFEVVVNNSFAKIPFNILDTLSDIFFDLSGGVAAILYFLKRIMPKNLNKVE